MEKKKIRKKWKHFTKKHNLEFNPIINVEAKTQTCLKYDGACPCLPEYRKSCPMEECLKDIERAGVCYCFLFKKKAQEIDFEEYPKMTKDVRDSFKLQS